MRHRALAGWVLTIILGLMGCSAEPTNPQTITVFAAASTADVITDLAARFEARTGIVVRTSFAGSSVLARQIVAGAAADLFLSANPAWGEHVVKHAWTHAHTAPLLGNSLVLVAPNNSRLVASAASLSTAFDLPGRLWSARGGRGRVALADPDHVPAGQYAAAALKRLGWWVSLSPGRLTGANVRAALRYVEMGEADVGVVYGTDAVASSAVRVLGVFPARSHPPIQYPLVVRANASEGALRFVAFLKSATGRRAFEGAGFSVIGEADDTVAAPPSMAIQRTPSVWPIIALSVKVAAISTVMLLPLGVFLGWLLARRRFPGRWLFDAVVHLPLVLPPVVIGYLLLRLMGRNGWLGGLEVAFTWHAAAVASAVMGLPLLVRSVRLAIELVDPHLEQAAHTLGASPVRAWATITLPLALPGVLAGAVLAFARSLGEFGATITFAGNVAGETRTLPLAIFSALQAPGGDALAMRLVGVSIIVSLVALGLSEWSTRRLRRLLGDPHA